MKKEKKMRSMFESTVKAADEPSEKKNEKVDGMEWVFVTVKMEKKINTELKIYSVNKEKPMWECIQNAVKEYMEKNK